MAGNKLCGVTSYGEGIYGEGTYIWRGHLHKHTVKPYGEGTIYIWRGHLHLRGHHQALLRTLRGAQGKRGRPRSRSSALPERQCWQSQRGVQQERRSGVRRDSTYYPLEREMRVCLGSETLEGRRLYLSRALCIRCVYVHISQRNLWCWSAPLSSLACVQPYTTVQYSTRSRLRL